MQLDILSSQFKFSFHFLCAFDFFFSAQNYSTIATIGGCLSFILSHFIFSFVVLNYIAIDSLSTSRWTMKRTKERKRTGERKEPLRVCIKIQSLCVQYGMARERHKWIDFGFTISMRKKESGDKNGEHIMIKWLHKRQNALNELRVLFQSKIKVEFDDLKFPNKRLICIYFYSCTTDALNW